MSQRPDDVSLGRRREGVAMTQECDRPTQVAVNLPELLARVDNDRELMCELFGIFKHEFPPLLRLLQESVACGDTKRVETTSHALTGMLSGLSATPAAKLAQRLEQMARAEEMLGLADALKLFEQAVANLLPELDRYTTKAEL
jgi:HPt (histidine-containing phosphotransfer) domain-containing protein